jgi:DNA-binding NarL/FixJ family response regulator
MADAAELEHRTGHRERAVKLLEQAIDDGTACGAWRAVERMQRRLNRLGVTGRGHRPAPADASPLDRLTAAERRIATLAAQGLTNGQIATAIDRSPHTVDSHLRKIFQKLGVSSRVALARIIAEAGQ